MTALHPSDAGSDGPISVFAKQWHYMPPVPIQVSPIFTWPPDSVKIANWIRDSWFPITERAILVGIALLSWFYFQPSMEQTRVLGFGWVTELYLRNLILMTTVAGGLHLYFYTWRRQGQRLQFDDRAFKKSSRAFTFNSQLYDNIFWTIVSGVAFWTAYEALMFWLMANGHAPLLVWSKHPVWFVALFFLRRYGFPCTSIGLTAGCTGRPSSNSLTRFTIAIRMSGWSGCQHPIEHLIYLSSVLIHWVVAASDSHSVPYAVSDSHRSDLARRLRRHTHQRQEPAEVGFFPAPDAPSVFRVQLRHSKCRGINGLVLPRRNLQVA